MEIGGVGKASLAGNVTFAGRQDAGTQQGAVKTQLPPTESVSQMGSVPDSAVQLDLKRQAFTAAERIEALRGFIERHNYFDQGTRSLVVRTVNTRTGEVLRQFPDDVTLKLRAFAREMREVDGDAAPAVPPRVTVVA